MNEDQISSTDLANIKVVTETIVGVVMPALLHAIAASRPGVDIVGDLMHTEPVRDYRKELWISVYGPAAENFGADTAKAAAEQALATFDEVFK